MAVAWLASGCLTPPAIVIDDLLEPLARPALWLPSDRDLAAAALARAALMSTPASLSEQKAEAVAIQSVKNALSDLRAAKSAEKNTSLIPLAIDLRNATLDNAIAYRDRSRELRKYPDLDPRISGRLDRIIGDDPIRLAKKRQFDGWHRLWARSFNAISQPLG
ncbi:MAG: hypothetical protein VCB25_03050, partial [Myxococcota bacterium]